MSSVVNQYGRRGGRGLRPWLLLPKVLCVAVYFGSLVTAAGLAVFAGPAGVDETCRGTILGWVLRGVTAPAAVGVFGFGLLLFMQHPQVFWKMRWLQIKAGLLTILVGVHFLLLRMKTGALFSAGDQFLSARTTGPDFAYGLLLTVLLVSLIILLGRLKPRLTRS